MKIFFFSTTFSPSTGGIETIVELLCREFVTIGHQVVLATNTLGEGDFPFPVLRRPGLKEFFRHLRWCDVHVQANVSIWNAWPRLLTPTKHCYQHNNVYQRDDTTKSVIDHLKTWIAKHSIGIANSNYTASRTGAKYVIYNAYNDNIFTNVIPWERRSRQLVFLGRFVSQKGIETLLDSLQILARTGFRPSLTLIGDGPDRAFLEKKSLSLGIAEQLDFVGWRKGEALAALLNEHRILVVPSSYEEPFGIVALEGLGCGCLPVVSERGGLVDAISGHGRTFPNGDPNALAAVLREVLTAPDRTISLLDGCTSHLGSCSPRAVAAAYIEVFESIRYR